VYLEKNEFIGNEANSFGVIYNSLSYISIKSSVFKENKALSQSSVFGIFNSRPKIFAGETRNLGLYVEDCLFEANES
jgi:hypothetical protein